MIYFFEDDRKDKLSKLFLAGYYDTEENKERLKYLKGNGEVNNAIGGLEADYKSGNIESTGIFLDLVPGNRDAHEIYYRARKLFVTTHKVFIVPIFCVEYEFIKSIANTMLLPMNDSVEGVLNNEVHFTNSILKLKNNKSDIRNFEHLCKSVLDTYTADCIRRDAADKEPGTTNYCRNKCPCTNPCEIAKSKSLEQKSKEYLQEYPCIPLYSKFSNICTKIDVQAYIDIHNKLIDGYNKLVGKYYDYFNCKSIEINQSIKTKYKYIRKYEWDAEINWWR